jgi:AraC-like DNA-binding protein
MAEQGLPGDPVLRGTGIGLADVDDPKSKTSIGQYLVACRNAVKLSADPATPFLVGRKMHLSAYGMYGYALMCSLTLRDFFNEGVKYHKLATPTVAIGWREESNAAIWSFPHLTSPELSADLHGFLIEQQLVQHATHLKDVAGPACRPVRATLSFPAPPHVGLYERFLGCPVFFNADSCELHFDAQILDKPTQLAHKLTSTLMQDTCERLIGQARTSVGLTGQIYQILMVNPGQLPAMDQIAQMLRMNERTLRRKLGAEGTSFGDIVDNVRTSLATEYLRTTKMTIEDIASLVGFSDAANFRRAFRRWTGRAPRDLRSDGTVDVD